MKSFLSRFRPLPLPNPVRRIFSEDEYETASFLKRHIAFNYGTTLVLAGETLLAGAIVLFPDTPLTIATALAAAPLLVAGRNVKKSSKVSFPEFKEYVLERSYLKIERSYEDLSISRGVFSLMASATFPLAIIGNVVCLPEGTDPSSLMNAVTQVFLCSMSVSTASHGLRARAFQQVVKAHFPPSLMDVP